MLWNQKHAEIRITRFYYLKEVSLSEQKISGPFFFFEEKKGKIYLREVAEKRSSMKLFSSVRTLTSKDQYWEVQTSSNGEVLYCVSFSLNQEKQYIFKK